MVAARRGGCIVDVGSMFGQQGVPEAAAYCMAKGAITLLTQSLALELAPRGIRVNTLSPGNMATEMHWDHVRSAALASEDAAYVTGQTIGVNGGALLT
jgi:NAD(P)-dependent dehydrogenase (short-subunit alcohol dehydrogenase family)